MSARLEDLPQAASTTGTIAPVVVAPKPEPAQERAADAESSPRVNVVDRDVDRGLGLLLRFVAGIAVMVADVLVVNAVGESWILIPALAVLLVTTWVIFAAIMRLLAIGAERSVPREP